MTATAYPPISKRYEIQASLGAGSMGQVYQAYDRVHNLDVALKHIAANATDTRLSTVSLANEFQIMTSLRHPNVIEVMDYGFDANRQPFFTMRLLKKKQNILEYGWQHPTETRIGLIIDTLSALSYMHQRDVLHRDLKPDNILIDDDKKARVLDFGLATLVKDGNYTGPEEEGDIVGTPMYMAPELFDGHAASQQSDLYAVGVLLYELLTGESPYKDPATLPALIFDILNQTLDKEHLTTRLIEHSAIDQNWNADALAEIIFRLMSKVPPLRYEHAQDVIEEICSVTGYAAPQENQFRASFLKSVPFIGRESEYQTLTRSVHDAVRGKGSFRVISGENGIGKSRLCREMRTIGLIEGMEVIQSQAVPDISLPYQIWQHPLSYMLMMTPADEKTASVLQFVLPEIKQIVGQSVPDAPTLEGSEQAQRLHRTTGNLFKTYFQQTHSPLLLILEDLQWASDESLALVDHIAGLTSDFPLLLVVNFRSEEAPHLVDKWSNAQYIQLKRLGLEEVKTLTRSIIRSDADITALAHKLQQETEGNLFFLIEAIRTLSEYAGSIENILTADLPQVITAGSIEQMLQKRIDLLPIRFHPLLRHAAAVGTDIDLDIMKHLAQQTDTDLSAWLDACANAALLTRDDVQWRFAHHKLCHQALASVSASQLRAIHAEITSAYEAVYPDNLADYAVELAHHFKIAGNPQKELHFARLAADQFFAVSQSKKAIRYYMRVIQLLDSEKTDTNMPLRLETCVALGQGYDFLGEWQQAHKYLDDVLNLTSSGVPNMYRSAAYLRKGWIYFRQGQVEKSQEAVARSLKILPGTEVHFKADILNLKGILSLVGGDYEAARPPIEEALAIARTIGEKANIAKILNTLGSIEEGCGNYEIARHHFEEAQTAAGAVGLSEVLANISGNLGRVAYYLEDYDEAKRHFLQAKERFAEIGHMYGLAISLYYLGYVYVYQGKPMKAFDMLRQSVALSQQMQAGSIMLLALCGFVKAWAHHEKWQKAVELLAAIDAHEASQVDVDIQEEISTLSATLKSQCEEDDYNIWYKQGQQKGVDTIIETERLTNA